MQKAATQQDSLAQHSVLRGAAGKVASKQKVIFLLLFRIFPSFLHAKGKNPVCREIKTVLREKFGRRCRTTGPKGSRGLGRDSGPGRDGAGAGPGGGGRACSYIKTCVGIG